MHWQEMGNSATEGEDCPVQFANGFGVGMGDQSFCPTELKCKPTRKEWGHYGFLGLIDKIG